MNRTLQQSVLAPFADSVSERFHEWLMDKAKAGTVFTPEQLAWLNLMRDQIATSLSIATFQICARHERSYSSHPDRPHDSQSADGSAP